MMLSRAEVRWGRPWAGCVALLVLVGACATTPVDESAPAETPQTAAAPVEPGGDLAVALVEAEKRLRGNPQDPELHYKLGNAFFDLRRYPQAAQAYQRAVELILPERVRKQVRVDQRALFLDAQ